MSAFIGQVMENFTEQVFAKLAPIIKQQIKPDFQSPDDEQMIAAFADQSISKVSGNANASSDSSESGNSSTSSSVPSSDSSA